MLARVRVRVRLGSKKNRSVSFIIRKPLCEGPQCLFAGSERPRVIDLKLVHQMEQQS